MSPLYIFLDESGNLDFSPKGTRFFTFGGVVKQRPFEAFHDLANLKYDIIEEGVDLRRFHACEDKQAVRDRVFEIIQRHIAGIQVEALVVEKRKALPSIQAEERFYGSHDAEEDAADFGEVSPAASRLGIQSRFAEDLIALLD